MKLYVIELKKILQRRSTWVLTGFMLVLTVVYGQLEIHNKQNMIVEFGQLAGYRRFLDLSGLFIVCAFLVEIIVLASYYCEDRQDKVDVLILTEKRGKLYDYAVRVSVTLAFVICLNIIMLMAAFVICHVNYGYTGGGLPVREMHMLSTLEEKNIFTLICMYLFNVFNASIMLSALVVCISTMSKNSIHSFIVIVGVVFLPVMLEGIFKNGQMNIGYTFITSQPVMLIAERCLLESGPVYGWHIFISYLCSIVACCVGGKKWCSVPKE